jgi:hypothetical protein
MRGESAAAVECTAPAAETAVAGDGRMGESAHAGAGVGRCRDQQ